MQRHLGILLVTVGLVLMTWPLATWAYGLYWQQQLSSDLPPISIVAGSAAFVSRGVVPSPEPTEGVKPKKAPKVTPLRPRKVTVVMASPKEETLSSAMTRLSGHSRSIRARTGKDGAFARLCFRRIDLDVLVVEGADRFSLRRGPRHLTKTGLPGESHNCAIAAHRDAWFERLHEAEQGDPVWLETQDAVFKYTVDAKMVVRPDRRDLLDQGARPVLTLITCTGPGYPQSAYRLLVFCRLRSIYPRTD